MARLRQEQARAVRSAGSKTVPDDIRGSTRELLNNIEKSWFTVSKNLYKIESDHLYHEWGFPTMEHYVQEELGYNYRNMRHRIAVGKTITNLGITEAQIEDIGEWTKLKALRPLLEKPDITAEEVTELLAEAKDKSVRDLEQIVRSRAMIAVGEAIQTVTLKFKVTGDQNTSITRVFDQIQNYTGHSLPGQVLEYLCLHFEMFSDFGAEQDLGNWIIENIEEVKKLRAGKEK